MSIDRTPQITFSASDELRLALDKEAFRSDASRASVIRNILADYLRETGLLRTTDPVTNAIGQTNYFFRPRRGR